MPPNPPAASPDGAAESSPGRAVMAMPRSPSVGGESPERLAWADLHEITRGEGFQNNRVIETGSGGLPCLFQSLDYMRLVGMQLVAYRLVA